MPNYSGVWTLQEQYEAILEGNWTGIPSGGTELYTWGVNDEGQLGTNTANTVDVSSPVQVGAGITWSKVSAGDEHGIALKTDGTLWAIGGRNDQGQLGQEDVVYRSSPIQIGADTDWSVITSGQRFNMAIKTSGSLWAWGDAVSGRMGTNSTAGDRSSPVQIGALTNWADVRCEYDGPGWLAIKTDGTLWVTGSNFLGKLGLGDAIDRSSPVQIGAETDWAKASFNLEHSLAVTTGGELYAWGNNTTGHLGDGTVVARSSPIQIGALTTWSDVRACPLGSLAIKTDGTLWAWGYNSLGMLGQNDTIDRSSPVQIGALTNWSKIAAGSNALYAIKTDGTLWAWGSNSGSLGDGTTVNTSSPIQIGSGTNWTEIDGGETFAYAIFDGTTRSGMS